MDPVVVSGSHFTHQRTGERFVVAGTRYLYDGHYATLSSKHAEQLEDPFTCARDIPYLQKLGVNVILVDWLRPGADYSACMGQLRAADIYVLAGLNGINESIFQGQTWDRELQHRFVGVMESMMGYSNLLGFYFLGSPITLPLVRAAIRDLKQHLKNRRIRKIPVGYMSLMRGKDFSKALLCGEEKDLLDFLILDIGSYCAEIPQITPLKPYFETAVAEHVDYPVPVVLSSWHCSGRTVLDVGDNLDFVTRPNVTGAMSGSILFSYYDSLRNNVTGLIDIKGNRDGPMTGPEFSAAANVLYMAKASHTSNANFRPTLTATPSCNSVVTVSSRPGWSVGFTQSTVMSIATNLPPPPNPHLCECMMSSLDCVSTHQDNTGQEYIAPDPTELKVAFEDEKKIVQKVCGQDDAYCTGTKSDPVSGVYGTYSVCNSTERGSWMLNQLYKAKNKDKATCSSAGGNLHDVASSRSQSGECKEFLRQAGPAGTGAITFTPLPEEQQFGVHRNGFPTAAKIGLAVGLAILVSFIVGAVLLLWRRRRRARARLSSPSDIKGGFETDTPLDSPVVTNEKQDRSTFVEIEGTQVLEIDATGPTRVEADSQEVVELESPVRHELVGSPVGDFKTP